MRWTRNDSLAYDTFSKAADDLKGWNEERELAKAYGLKPEETQVTGYDIGDDPTGIQSTQYRMGGVTRDKPFSQDEIDRARMDAVTNAYGRLGKPGEALKMRAAGVQLDAARQGLKKGDFELRALEDADRERVAINDAFSLYQKARSGDKDALTKLLQVGVEGYNKNPDGTEYADGNTAIFDAEAGRLHVMDGSGAVRSVSIDQLDKPKLDQLLNHGFRSHLAAVSPKTYAEVAKLNAQDQELYFKGIAAHAARKNADTMERYRLDQNGHLVRADQLARDEFDAKSKGGFFRRTDPSAGLGQPIGLSKDGTKMLFANPRGGLQEVPVPAGYEHLFPKVTGDRPARDPKLIEALSTRYAEDFAGLDPRAKDFDARLDALNEKYRRAGLNINGGQAGGAPSIRAVGNAIVDSLGNPGAAPAAQPSGGLRPSTGQTRFGILTPESVIRAEAQAGNQAAIDYLRRREAARTEDEQYRGQFGFGGGF